MFLNGWLIVRAVIFVVSFMIFSSIAGIAINNFQAGQLPQPQSIIHKILDLKFASAIACTSSCATIWSCDADNSGYHNHWCDTSIGACRDNSSTSCGTDYYFCMDNSVYYDNFYCRPSDVSCGATYSNFVQDCTASGKICSGGACIVSNCTSDPQPSGGCSGDSSSPSCGYQVYNYTGGSAGCTPIYAYTQSCDYCGINFGSDYTCSGGSCVYNPPIPNCTQGEVCNACGGAAANTCVNNGTSACYYTTHPSSACNQVFSRSLTCSYDNCSAGYACNISSETCNLIPTGQDLGFGTSPVRFSKGITGLTAGTTYLYCAVAQNSAGTAYGNMVSFVASVGVDLMVINSVFSPAIALTGNDISFSGDVTNSGSSGTGSSFSVQLSIDRDNNSSWDLNDTKTGIGPLASGGTQAVSWTNFWTNAPSGTHVFRICADQPTSAIAETSESNNCVSQVFTVGAKPPTIFTNNPTNVLASGATLNGIVTPNGSATTAWFRYSTSNLTCSAFNDSNSTRTASGSDTTVAATFGATDYTVSVGGLTGGTTYFYCAIANNAGGVAYGNVVSFVASSGSPPDLITLNAENVTDTSAKLVGTVDPNGANTGAWFRWGAVQPAGNICTNDAALWPGSSVTSTTFAGNGTSAIPYAYSISGLTTGQTYYYCAIGNNSVGMGYGAVVPFTAVLLKPSVVTNPANPVNSDSAVLNGYVNSNGSATTAWFRYWEGTSPGSCTEASGTRVPIWATDDTSISSEIKWVLYSNFLSGLTINTNYWYCAIAKSAIGTALGSLQQFTTTAASPLVDTYSPLDVTLTSATLRGAANPMGGATTAWFRYWRDDDPARPAICADSGGTRLPLSSGFNAGSGTAYQPYSNNTGNVLVGGHTYFYCAIAQNPTGFGYGSMVSFVAGNATLSVDLTTTPPNPVDPGIASYLYADVIYTGNPTDTINYSVWWNCSDPTTSVGTAVTSCGALPVPVSGSCVINLNGAKCDGVFSDPLTLTHEYSVGTHTPKVIAERGPVGVLPAQDQENIIVQALPDLVVINYGFTPTSPLPGAVLTFYGTVLNDGSFAAGNSQTSLRIDLNNDGSWDILPAAVATPALEIDYVYRASWPDVATAQAGIHKYEICADTPGKSVNESKETNNCVSKIFYIGFCVNECAPSGADQCYSIRTYQDCGEHDVENGTTPDTCLEWGPDTGVEIPPPATPPDTPCPPRNTCVAGLCVPAPNWIEVAPQRNE